MCSRFRKRCCSAAYVRPFMTIPTSCYIHLPFCAQRCHYCAFPIIISGRTALPSAGGELVPPLAAHVKYVDLLCREVRATVANRKSKVVPLSTVYFGGGTPSLMHPSLVSKVIETVDACIGIESDAEVTCEMDPATFTMQSARAFRGLGMNRASVGAQSFSDGELAACGRVHKERDIYVAMEHLRKGGFENVSMDLICGLPGQTLKSWENSLEQVVKLGVEHVSGYDLELEEGTDFGKRFKSGMRPLPSEGDSVEMLQMGMEVLKRGGYEHYEVSNYAKKGRRSRHNMAYWRNEEFYGFGLGATSLVEGVRFARPRGIGKYTEHVQELEEGKCEGRSARSERERLEDLLINGFRLLIEGVSLRKVEEEFGKSGRERLEAGIRKVEQMDKGLIEVVEERARLTERGAVIENSVLATLMHEAVWQYTPDG